MSLSWRQPLLRNRISNVFAVGDGVAFEHLSGFPAANIHDGRLWNTNLRSLAPLIAENRECVVHRAQLSGIASSNPCGNLLQAFHLIG